MNTLPKEIQILIGEYNVSHRPMMKIVLNQLVKKYKISKKANKKCDSCNTHLGENNGQTTFIFWKKYKFCNNSCQYDTEYDIRKSYREYMRNKTK